ncbi:MAG: anthranilate phosphoribosyltransferase [Candidatus Hodarchaeota archaeon]
MEKLEKNFGIKDAIHKKIVDKKKLTESEAYTVMHEIMSGSATPAQIGAFLVSLKTQGADIMEIKSFVTCMKDFANVIKPKVSKPVVDTCGTGGDELKTINISTITALVAAGAGIPVAKHGNRSVTSPCGSADVFEAAGVNLTAAPETVEKCIEKVGIGFMFAPVFHPAMKHAIGPRREIGLRTVFNILGPLTNPANASGQVLGVFSNDVSSIMAKVLKELDVKRFYIVHNEHGADELLPVGKNYIVERVGSELREYTMEASYFKLEPVKRGELVSCSTKEDSLKAFVEIMKGSGSDAMKKAVLMNSALAIMAGEGASDVIDAIEVAKNSLESGDALEKLKLLVQETSGDLGKYESLIK